MIIRAYGNGDAHGILFAIRLGGEREASAVASGCAEIEPDVSAAARLETRLALAISLDADALGPRFDLDFRRPAQPMIDDRARDESVTLANEAWQRGSCDQRPRHQER
jgi:hypothetical protein